MSKIIIKSFNIFDDLSNTDSYLLIINNKQLLYKFLQSINQFDNTYIKIVDNYNNELKNSDYIDIVTSIILIDPNTKKNINALIRKIKQLELENLKISRNIVLNEIENSFKKINANSNIELISDIDFTEDDFLKFMNINVQDNYETLLERINNYINVTYELRNIRVFIFYNLLAFLSEDEVHLLLHDNKYKDIKIINIECYDNNYRCFDHKKLIDEDICLLDENLL